MGETVKGNEGHTHIGEGGNIVEIRRLDDYIRTPVRLIKIDVEGAEYDVLLGARQTLQASKPTLLIEIQTTNQEKVFSLLEGLGYSRTSLGKSNFQFVAATPKAEVVDVPAGENPKVNQE